MQAPCENRRDSDAQPHEALIRKKSLLTIHSFFAVLVMMFVVTFIVVIGIDFLVAGRSYKVILNPMYVQLVVLSTN